MSANGGKGTRNKHPQELVSDFWSKFFAKKQGKVTSIFPKSLYASLLPSLKDPRGTASSRNAAESYESAANECREKTDPDRNCLNGLVRYELPESDPASSRSAGDNPRLESRGMRGISSPLNGVGGDADFWTGAVHRIDWIFEKPQFTIDGFSSSDIVQGANGDCWWLAAVATIAHRRELMNKCCVARDEECGVYGFVFQRDGEWVSTVVDDNLYLESMDFLDTVGDQYDPSGKKAKKYREANQRGSEALYFSKCADPNETWIPLLEKAYAKLHGDYEAIYGGWSGEGVEDMTGGVTTTINAKRALNKDKLWKELANDLGDFVFAASAIGAGSQNGLFRGHAYSILKATEEVDEDGNKVRLVQIRNPWGQRGDDGVGEWAGAWSDGSKEWTGYWLKKLGHTFGDDGVFWMSYEDMLESFLLLHRTRIFDEKWNIIQQWTSVSISWVTGYLQTKFLLEVTKNGTVVIVLTQLDDRFFQGLEGQYDFALHFLLQKENGQPGEHLSRVRPVNPWEKRSVSCEIDLEPGRYEVLPKVTAVRDIDKKPVEEVVKHWAEKNPQKLRQVGMIYDLTHAKGGIPDEDQILETKKAEEKRKRALEKQKAKEDAKKSEDQANANAGAAAIQENGTVPQATEVVEVGSKEKEDAAPDEKEGFENAKEVPQPSDEKTTNGEEQKASKVEIQTGSSPGALPERKKKESDDDQKKKNDDEEKRKDKDDKEDDDLKKKVEDREDEESESESDSDDNDEETRPQWNAVCVMGLRVYSLDSNVSIKLVKPSDAQEASSLTMDETPAGATM